VTLASTDYQEQRQRAEGDLNGLGSDLDPREAHTKDATSLGSREVRPAPREISKLFLVFSTAPLGLIGAVAALLTFNAPFGFVALLGVIALAGMIMRNTVILIDQIDHDLAAGLVPWDAVVESTVRRARPVVLTALAAILAMIPLARSVFWGPMALSIMGGLLVATVLTLVFLPALYAAWFRVRKETLAQPTQAIAIAPQVRKLLAAE
jgi:multidrug efflux pump